jgi:NTE family protein
VSLIRGRKAAGMLDEGFGDIRIEELALPFFCVSADLVRRELVVHRTGRVADAVLASLSIPGVFPPVVDRHGRLLADGGVIDNLPVREMASAGEGPVVAVDVTGVAAGSRRVRRGGRLAPPRDALRRRVTGTETPLPRLSETIVRCMTLASTHTVDAGRKHADLVIAPDVAGIGMLDWRRRCARPASLQPAVRLRRTKSSIDASPARRAG